MCLIKREKIFKTFTVGILLLINSSCYAQKMVQRLDDAKILQLNEKQFISKPLKDLLAQIAPKIKSAIGNPDNFNKRQNTFIFFYFVDKNEGLKMERQGEKPVYIYVILQKPNGKTYPPILPSNPWTKQQTKEYGDMTVLQVHIGGGNNGN